MQHFKHLVDFGAGVVERQGRPDGGFESEPPQDRLSAVVPG
jgi:hypothetical protein